MITKNNTSLVMQIFFKHPEGKFHLRELERMTGLSLPGVRKIANNLVKEGLLESKKEKLVKNYYAKRDEKFINLKRAFNIYSIFSSGLLKFLVDTYNEPEAVVLFGSYSKGEDITKSDIDIAIITPKHRYVYKYIDLDTFEKKLSRKIKLYEIKIEKAEKEFLNALINGVVLYGYLKVIQ